MSAGEKAIILGQVEKQSRGKRLALDMLGITVWLDGKNVEITGTIDPESVIVHTPSYAGYSLIGWWVGRTKG